MQERSFLQRADSPMTVQRHSKSFDLSTARCRIQSDPLLSALCLNMMIRTATRVKGAPSLVPAPVTPTFEDYTPQPPLNAQYTRLRCATYRASMNTCSLYAQAPELCAHRHLGYKHSGMHSPPTRNANQLLSTKKSCLWIPQGELMSSYQEHIGPFSKVLTIDIL